MNYDETYDGRKPSFGRTRQGQPFIRGFRSKPGAPMHDPTGNIPLSQNRMTPQSNWDSMFRNTASNSFGQTENPRYTSSFPTAPSAPASPGQSPQNYANNDIMADEQFGGGVTPFSGPTNHAQEWSMPSQKPPLLSSSGWQITPPAQQRSIFDRFKPKSDSFGWGSAFEQT